MDVSTSSAAERDPVGQPAVRTDINGGVLAGKQFGLEVSQNARFRGGSSWGSWDLGH